MNTPVRAVVETEGLTKRYGDVLGYLVLLAALAATLLNRRDLT